MKAPIVIIGIGQLAGVFARGFLQCGHPVYPITRNMDLAQHSELIPSPDLILITVQENELQTLLKQLPNTWRGKIGLVQNELLPQDWQKNQIEKPTVTVVWFEKKKNMEVTNILYSPSFGPKAILMSNALQSFEIPAPILENHDDLLYELLRKAVYILTVNIAGLLNNCTVEELWIKHTSLAREIAGEVIIIQESLMKKQLPREKLIAGMVEGIMDCPHRYCLGRSAIARLQRTLLHAQQANIETPKLLDIYRLCSK